jgi:transcriptional regulator with XRE-family HTH domain
MIDERIKKLREMNNLTQAELARKLGISRASVNSWEMGLSNPSTTYLIEMSKRFHVSVDYLLGINRTTTIDVSGLEDSDIEMLQELTNHLRSIRGIK